MTPEQIEAYVDAAAAANGLSLDPAHRPGVLRYFSLASEMADLLSGLPLTPLDEPTESFIPVGPAEHAAP